MVDDIQRNRHFEVRPSIHGVLPCAKGGCFRNIMDDIKIHPIAACYPILDGKELEEFVADVKANGLINPIVFLNDELIDGRNRLLAIQQLGWSVSDHRKVLTDKECPDVLAYITSINDRRRHMSASARGAVASDIAKLQLGSNQHVTKEGMQLCIPSQQAAAEKLQVSVRSVRTARKVAEKVVPEVMDEVKKSHISLATAAAVSELPKPDQKKLAKQGPEAIKDAAKKAKKAKPKPEPDESVEQRSQFEPSDFDPAMKKDGEPVATLERSQKLITKMRIQFEQIRDGLAPMMRSIDSDNAAKLVKNFKYVEANYRALFGSFDATWNK